MNNSSIRLILSDIRSAQNVGSILRTADAFGVDLVYACGYTPHPAVAADTRPAHVITSNNKAISKTALGAELNVPVVHYPDATSAVRDAQSAGYEVIVLEQAERSLSLSRYTPVAKIALVLGNEVDGVSEAAQELAATVLEIPMLGAKESLNVAVAAGIAIFHLRYPN